MGLVSHKTDTKPTLYFSRIYWEMAEDQMYTNLIRKKSKTPLSEKLNRIKWALNQEVSLRLRLNFVKLVNQFRLILNF